jgi:hypothetical protein
MQAKFIDVDFSQQPQFVRGDNGHNPLRDAGRFTTFADETDVIPESRWKEEAEAIQRTGGGCSALVTRIYNQGREGSCVANAASQGHEINQARQHGKPRVVPLSAISLYKRIGRSPSSGAMVSDGLEEMADRGILPLDTAENRARFGDHVMPPTGFHEKFPSGWESTAKLLTAHEWVICNSVEEIISALLRQWPVMVGRSGHAITYCDVVYDGNTLRVKYANSWGNWGENGFGYDSMKLIKSSARWAYALRSVTAPAE